MLKLKTKLHHLPEFEQVRKLIEKNQSIHLKGIYGSLLAIVISYLKEMLSVPQMIVLSNTDMAEKLNEDLETLMSVDEVSHFPTDEVVPFDEGIFTPALYSLRMRALTMAVEKQSPVIITTPSALFKKVPNPETIKHNIIHLEVNEDFDRELLIDWLSESGYERMNTIEELGQYSVRGGIVDVFSFESDTPYRLEFFGDTIESIREFEILSQLSTNQLQRIRLLGDSKKSNHDATLFDYFGSGSILFWEDFTECKKQLNDLWNEAENAFCEKKDKLEISSLDEKYVPPQQLLQKAEGYRQIHHSHLNVEKVIDINFQSVPSSVFGGSLKLFVNHIRNQIDSITKSNDQDVFILHNGKTSKDRLKEILEAELGDLIGIKFVDGELQTGFNLPNYNIEIFTDHEIFNRLKMRRRKRKIRISGGLIRNLKNLNIGDYVVHLDYGIGKYKGTEQINIAGAAKEKIKLIYQDGAILYVSLDKLNHIQKYVSEEGYEPKLTKLGGTDWERVKKKTKKAVETIAKELVRLYAVRISKNGHTYSSDTLWQKELEASFLFEDTTDQIKATMEVKQDMESPKPMDRLICGDVGFGKTEIAVRAAFKTVMEGKQAAILSPTTILAQQHCYTFKQRMLNFPLNIEVISRFKTQKEQKEIIKKLAEGEIDIIIGTHRLLSKDIKFKDIGLLVVDEEQRFGVKQKEKIKELKMTVDTLTMTATPIPRTLHMALMGARDLSNVDTPPNNRLPIITEITTWDPLLIYKAITYEMERGGQIYFVHNRVQTIDSFANAIRNIVPKARLAVAHGQMREKQLEAIMNDFYHKKYDVLLATMIIENGLDIPNCNTIIVNRADKFGLSQLYQLRGRVGRSDRQAYAYLIIPPQERLNETSIKRLYAIEEFGDLGSGLKVAMRDLEIRGAGNLLGHKQSGFINAVGYDLYQKILKETVENIQSDTLPVDYIKHRLPEVDASVDVDVDMYFSDEYIGTASEKVSIYHRLLNLDNLHLIDNLAEELKDRFGPLPEPAENLIEMVKIKKLASQLYIKQVRIVKNEMVLKFDPRATEKDIFVEKELSRYVNQKMTELQFTQSEQLSLNVKLKGNNNRDRISFAKYFLLNL